MKTQHTPGPWRIEKLEITASVNGEYFAPICQVDPEWSDGGSEANARLIAAAPELLEACQYIAYASEGIESIDLGNEEALQITITGQALKDLKEAIKKAIEG